MLVPGNPGAAVDQEAADGGKEHVRRVADQGDETNRGAGDMCRYARFLE